MPELPWSKARFVWRKVLPGMRVILSAESTWASVCKGKKLSPLPKPKQGLRMLWLSHLDQVDPAWAAKASVYNVYWRNVCPAKRVTLPSCKRVSILEVLAFCFLCKQCAKFYKEMNKKLARSGWLGYASDPSP